MYKVKAMGLCLFFSKPEERVSMCLLDQEQAVFSCLRLLPLVGF